MSYGKGMVMTDRLKRKKELQDGFIEHTKNHRHRSTNDAEIYAYVLYEELGYELKFDFYENEFHIFSEGQKIGSCLNLSELQYDERIWNAISILDEPDYEDIWEYGDGDEASREYLRQLQECNERLTSEEDYTHATLFCIGNDK